MSTRTWPAQSSGRTPPLHRRLSRMTSRPSFTYTALVTAAVAGVHWLADVARLGYGIPVRSGPVVWGTVGVIVLFAAAIGAWRGARWAPEVWLLGFSILLARVVYAVFVARPTMASVSPTGTLLVFGIWLATALWACRHAWVARQAGRRAAQSSTSP